MELYLNDTLLDLPANYLIALSYAVNTLTDLSTVQGNISNSIALPATANNRAALGYPDDLNYNGAAIIRSKLPCRYVQNGVDVIPQGNLRIVGTEKGALKVVLSNGNTDFFDLLTGKLRDLDMSEYDHVWNQANVVASRTQTDGYIYPIINYGNVGEGDSSIDAQQMRPAVFAKYIVRKVVESAGYTLADQSIQLAGYTLDDEILADAITAPIYNNLLLPFSNDKFVHSARYINTYMAQNVQVENSTQQNALGLVNGTVVAIGFDQKIADAGNLWNGASWVAPQIMTVDINVQFPHIQIQRYAAVGDNSKGLYLKIYQSPAGAANPLDPQYKIFEPDSLGLDLDSGIGDHLDFAMQLSSISVQPGDKITIAFETAGTPGGGGIDVHIYPGAVLNISLNGDKVNFGETVQLEGNLPDMACKDFLKFISFMFCAVIQTDNVNKVVSIVPFGHIVQNIPKAIDWSDRITQDGEDFDVQVGDYCQQNEAKYKHDDTVSPDTYGNGSFYINDQNLDLYQDVYDIPFAASFENLVLGGMRTLFINKIPAGSADWSTQTEPRICLLNPTGGTLNYNTNGNIITVNDNIPLCYFTSAAGGADLTMTSIFKNHYPDLLAVLNDQRKLTCYLKLTEEDIQTLNFFIPIYISKYQCYFYLSKITDFTGLKPCKVELVRLF